MLIALFDIWIANEDRNSNNYNLLFDASKPQREFIVIDHGAAFNTLNINKKISPLTIEDSLLSSPLLKLIFPNKKTLSSTFSEVRLQFIRQAPKVQSQIDDWIERAPIQWNVRVDDWKNHCHTYWLTQEWTLESINTFLQIAEAEF